MKGFFVVVLVMLLAMASVSVQAAIIYQVNFDGTPVGRMSPGPPT